MKISGKFRKSELRPTFPDVNVFESIHLIKDQNLKQNSQNSKKKSSFGIICMHIHVQY